tara:strand:- start:619 stop:1095 length:477 start_codon:yes stop_codon:yes gene_type:complete
MSSKKNIVFFILILVVVFKIQAQHDKVKWVIYFPDIARVDKTVDILFKANIKPHCYIFSVNKKAVNQSKNTSIWFRENGDFKIIEKPEAIYEVEYFNRNNNQKEYIIEVEGGFALKIKVLKPNPIIKGQINYVLCNRGTNQEITQVYHFEIQLKTKNK